MPLASHKANAHVIIAELEQPHRFQYSLNCSCGFQHHGYAADAKFGDDLNDMKASARAHLAARHLIPADEADKYIEVAPFAHVGGLAHDQLKLRISQHKEALEKKAAEAKAKVATAAKEVAKDVVKGVVTGAAIAAAAAQSGGVTK